MGDESNVPYCEFLKNACMQKLEINFIIIRKSYLRIADFG